jgi:hypothetical protein
MDLFNEFSVVVSAVEILTYDDTVKQVKRNKY